MDEIQPFIQYGGLGIAAFALWILYRQNIAHNKMMCNHEQHFIDICKENTESTKENTKVLQELKNYIISLKR